MQVSDIMEKVENVIVETDDAQVALEVMQTRGLKVAPVTDNSGQAIGLVWQSDLVKAGSSKSESDNLDEALDETFPASDPVSPS